MPSDLARAAAPVPGRVGPDPDRTERYADADTGVWEAWEPAGRVRGVTMALVHGGFWKALHDRTHLRPLAGALAADGFHVASVEYPRVGMPGGGWPGTCDAVAAALAAVVADPLLPAPVVAAGHSAGGHLVAWCASAPPGSGRERVPGLAGVVPLAGVVDLAVSDALALGDHAVRALFGLPRPAGDDRPAGPRGIPPESDPARLRLRLPAVLVHGTADTVVPVEVSEAYLASREPSDASCRLVRLPGADHFALVDPLDAAYGALLDAVGAIVHPAHPPEAVGRLSK